MTREFLWRKTASRIFLLVVGTTLLVAVTSFAMIALSLNEKGNISDWVGFPFFCSIVLLVYLLPRILGVLRNRMKVTITDEGLETPLGRHVPASILRTAEILDQHQRPHWVRFGGVFSVRIFLDFYEDPDGLFQSLRGFQNSESGGTS